MSFKNRIQDHLKNNYGKYLTGAGVLGAGYLGNEYLNNHLEFTNNAKLFGNNAYNIWSSDLPLTLKPKITGEAWDNAIYNYKHNINPDEAQAQTEIKLPNLGKSEKFLSFKSDFIGVPNKGFTQDGFTKDFQIYFDPDKYKGQNSPGITLGGYDDRQPEMVVDDMADKKLTTPEKPPVSVIQTISKEPKIPEADDYHEPANSKSVENGQYYSMGEHSTQKEVMTPFKSRITLSKLDLPNNTSSLKSQITNRLRDIPFVKNDGQDHIRFEKQLLGEAPRTNLEDFEAMVKEMGNPNNFKK